MSLAAGYPSVIALPLRLATRTLGCLNLFMANPTPLTPADISLAQALTDVASIAIVQAEIAERSAVVQSQLERALDSRVVIEQAKGMIAQSTGGDMNSAFTQIRAYARSNNQQLTDVCRRLSEGLLEVDGVVGAIPPRRS